tara:strand:+ start:1389 stop:1937 length:549 start_codon:yes stop_codon:yes gene_type:complete
MSRNIPVSAASMTKEQQTVYDKIASGPRGHVRGPFPVLLHSPKMADHVQQLGSYIRFECRLPDRLRELAVLVTSRFWGAEFEWFAHQELALKAGIPGEAIEAIRTGRRPNFLDNKDEAVYRFCQALHEEHVVDDKTYQTVQELLGQEVLTDLIAMSGYYTLLAMILNVYEVPLPDGSRAFDE